MQVATPTMRAVFGLHSHDAVADALRNLGAGPRVCLGEIRDRGDADGLVSRPEGQKERLQVSRDIFKIR